MSLFALVSLLITLAAVASYVNYRYIKLPTTVGVMLVALVGSLTLVLGGSYAVGFREQAATLVSRIDFDQVVLHGMLAFLLFAGSIHVNLEELGREWLPISLLAIFGTIVSTCIVGGLTWLVLGWLGLGIPFLHALLFGALISPTDAIAVLGIMKSVGASRQLEVQVAGESLFNDGLGVVVFLTLLELSGPGGAAGSPTAPLSIGMGAVGMLILKEVGGAVVLGLAAGFVTFHMLKRVDNYQVEVCSLSRWRWDSTLWQMLCICPHRSPSSSRGCSWATRVEPSRCRRRPVNTSTPSGSSWTRFSTSSSFS